MACAQALRDAGYKLLRNAFRENAKYSRFFSIALEVKQFDDVGEVQEVVTRLLATAKEQFPKAEAVLQKVFRTA